MQDIFTKMRLLNLPLEKYSELANHLGSYLLDFDDLYQYTLAKAYDLKIVTMDRDFKKVKNSETSVVFL